MKWLHFWKQQIRMFHKLRKNNDAMNYQIFFVLFFLLNCSNTSMMCGQNLVVRNKHCMNFLLTCIFSIDKIYNDGKSGGWLLIYTRTNTFHSSVLFLSRMHSERNIKIEGSNRFYFKKFIISQLIKLKLC